MERYYRITRDPNILDGKPCIRGMRLSVRRVVLAMAASLDFAELKLEYPELEPDDVREALSYAAFTLEPTEDTSSAGMITRRRPQYTAIVQQHDDSWIGWIEEIEGVNSRGASREKLLDNLQKALRERLEVNRSKAKAAATGAFDEVLMY